MPHSKAKGEKRSEFNKTSTMKAVFTRLFNRKSKIKLFFWFVFVLFIFNLHKIATFSDETSKQIRKEVNFKSYSTNLTVNGCIFVLLPFERIENLKKTIKQFESAFNQKANYPYVILNNEPFSISIENTIRDLTQSKVEFGLISSSQWEHPKWIEKQRADESLNKIGFTTNYRHMCRYMAGFFFKHELMLKYDWFIRIDTDSEFGCPFEDPIRQLVNRNSSYGFILTAGEASSVVPTLWSTVQSWRIKTGKKYENENKKGTLDLVSRRGSNLKATQLDSMCMFYNNFEVGSLKMLRGEAYSSYFEHLDKAGGFYYERWGDSPIRTYFMLLTQREDQIYQYKNIAYKHQGETNFRKSMNESQYQIQTKSCWLSKNLTLFERFF